MTGILKQSMSVGLKRNTRYLKEAMDRGYAKNTETKRGVEAKYILHEPLPEENFSVLPTPEELKQYHQKDKIFLVPPLYSVDQFFWEYDEYLEKENLSSEKAFRFYMQVCDEKNRRFDVDREGFEFEYDTRYVLKDMFRDHFCERAT